MIEGPSVSLLPHHLSTNVGFRRTVCATFGLELAPYVPSRSYPANCLNLTNLSKFPMVFGHSCLH